MDATVEAQLASVRAAQQEFDQQLEEPAPVDALVRLTTAARQRLQGYDVPPAYLDLLAIANGIEWLPTLRQSRPNISDCSGPH